MKAFGQFDSCAFRTFSNKEYAEQFVTGEIRFGSIYYYREIEDEKLRDIKEGNAHIVVKSRSKFAMFGPNTAIYIVSCHRTFQSAKEDDRPFIVEIANPKQLAEDISEELHQLPMKSFGGIEGVFVEYTKGEVAEQKPTSKNMARLAYAQKPPEFSKEKEFRFVLIGNVPEKDPCKQKNFLTVRIRKKIDYFKIHSNPTLYHAAILK